MSTCTHKLAADSENSYVVLNMHQVWQEMLQGTAQCTCQPWHEPIAHRMLLQILQQAGALSIRALRSGCSGAVTPEALKEECNTLPLQCRDPGKQRFSSLVLCFAAVGIVCWADWLIGPVNPMHDACPALVQTCLLSLQVSTDHCSTHLLIEALHV